MVRVHRDHIFPRENVNSYGLADIFYRVLYGHQGDGNTAGPSSNVESQRTHYAVFDLDPWPLAQYELIGGGLGSATSGLSADPGGLGLDNSLFSDNLRSIRLVFHPIREVFGPVRLFASSDSQIMSIGPARMHFVPLEADEQRRDGGHEDSNFSPPQGAPLKASHIVSYLLEMVGAFWLRIRSVDWLGYVGRKGHVGSLLLLSGYALSL
jgi:hypothetical protein